jgi:predicted exporter
VLGSRPGLEILSPMATVMLGGVVSATLMTMFVLPAIYAGFAGETERDSTEDLLHRWAGVARAPAVQAAGSGAILVNPDVAPPDHGRERILPRGRRSDAPTEPVTEPPPPKAG